MVNNWIEVTFKDNMQIKMLITYYKVIDSMFHIYDQHRELRSMIPLDNIQSIFFTYCDAETGEWL